MAPMAPKPSVEGAREPAACMATMWNGDAEEEEEEEKEEEEEEAPAGAGDGDMIGLLRRLLRGLRGVSMRALLRGEGDISGDIERVSKEPDLWDLWDL